MPLTHYDFTWQSTEDCESLALLEQFFATIDRGSLLAGPNPVELRRTRREVHRALVQLLIWDRAFLESEKGILWPLGELAKRAGYFEQFARNGDPLWKRRQAQLFLALLPVPGQWRWLTREEARKRVDPEVQSLLIGQSSKISKKIQSKASKRFRLRNICQVLKAYRGPQAKGILRIFSIPYFFAQDELLQALTSRYVLYVEPAMGVFFRHSWGRAFSKLQDPCVFGMPGTDDRQFLDSQSNILSIPIAHGDFLEDTDLPPRPVQPKYDLVFNATFDDLPRKRHHLMLNLLQASELRETTVLFLGRGEPAAVADFSDRVRNLGLHDRVSVAANVRRTSIPDYLADCKVAVHLSLNENGCRCIPEFFRSNLPCVVSSAMAGLDFSVINDQTGRVVADRHLVRAIAQTLRDRHRFTPRRWFLDHSGSQVSTARLNSFFRDLFVEQGYAWDRDLVALTSSGASRYLRKADYQLFLPDFQWLMSVFEKLRPLPINLVLE